MIMVTAKKSKKEMIIKKSLLFKMTMRIIIMISSRKDNKTKLSSF